jgi:transaldolase
MDSLSRLQAIGMELFLDSADINEIQEAAHTGLVDGVTTNPTLLYQQKTSLENILLKICHLVDGPVSAECVETEYEAMLAEARHLAAVHANVVVKIPMTPIGLRCVKALTEEQIRTNVTLIFSVSQGLLAAKAGATYISPFMGRWDDIGGNSTELIQQLVQLLNIQGYATRVLAASVRSCKHVAQVAIDGADACTVPYKIFRQMFCHPQTDLGLKIFTEHAAKSNVQSLH